MNHTDPLAVSELAAQVGGKVIGDGNVLIGSIASLEAAGEGDIAYVEDEKFFEAASASKASCVIVPANADVKAACRIEARKPKLAFALIAELLHPSKMRAPAIHPTAVIAATAEVDESVYLG